MIFGFVSARRFDGRKHVFAEVPHVKLAWPCLFAPDVSAGSTISCHLTTGDTPVWASNSLYRYFFLPHACRVLVAWLFGPKVIFALAPAKLFFLMVMDGDFPANVTLITFVTPAIAIRPINVPFQPNRRQHN